MALVFILGQLSIIIVRAPPGFWHHAAGRREAPAENIEWISMFLAKSAKMVAAVTWVWTSFVPVEEAWGVPTPNEVAFWEFGSQAAQK